MIRKWLHSELTTSVEVRLHLERGTAGAYPGKMNLIRSNKKISIKFNTAFTLLLEFLVLAGNDNELMFNELLFEKLQDEEKTFFKKLPILALDL